MPFMSFMVEYFLARKTRFELRRYYFRHTWQGMVDFSGYSLARWQLE
jgi:hypothetical protein